MPRRTLYLIRHAKSSWKDSELLDRHRPLNKRGHRNASDMAAHLSAREPRPDLIVSSPAKRALHTAQYFAHAYDYPSFDIQIEEKLYFCGIKGWLSTLKQLPNDALSVMLFGHNPEISQLITWLSEENMEPVPTCTICKIEVNAVKWDQLESEVNEIRFSWSPKDSASLSLSLAVSK